MYAFRDFDTTSNLQELQERLKAFLLAERQKERNKEPLTEFRTPEQAAADRRNQWLAENRAGFARHREEIEEVLKVFFRTRTPPTMILSTGMKAILRVLLLMCPSIERGYIKKYVERARKARAAKEQCTIAGNSNATSIQSTSSPATHNPATSTNNPGRSKRQADGIEATETRESKRANNGYNEWSDDEEAAARAS
ncbi:uncharacterized protein PAC_18935 [Phialocephala subalpina]|uniref:Uncharacterized protein n=1 Tax=Phialocephala subalpina TaxID=576137 RepID=A0A1L7XVF5_9HELO|nr:uncharacterized protein PAC_18935 [Phialocephala subalpina]